MLGDAVFVHDGFGGSHRGADARANFFEPDLAEPNDGEPY